MRFTAIDFETANSAPESACSVGIVMFEDGVMSECFSSLIKPHPHFDSFHPGNMRIHHITPDQVKNAPSFRDLESRLRPLLENSVLVAHNAPFDMRVLKSLYTLYGLRAPQVSYFCTVDLSRVLFPHLPHHRLNDVCEYLHVELDHHDALSDARGCALIVANAMNLMGVYEVETMIEQVGMRLKPL